MADNRIAKMAGARRVLAEFEFAPKELERGYADQWLRIDLDAGQMDIRPVTQQMKDLFTGGKGFDLWLTMQEIDRHTKWDSHNNPICFSSGPLGGTVSFPGSGKTLVTAVSPITGSMIDCNVGGYFGPYLKFAGFDALMLIGKAAEEAVVYIDAVNHRVTIEAAPEESVDSHVLAEELTEMYADDEMDRRNISVVSAGKGAQHSRMGVLNFSFYDWRRQAARLKQAGRGGVGTVFRDKKLKALVIKNRGITPAWQIAQSKAAGATTASVCTDCGTVDLEGVRSIIAQYEGAPENALHMLQEIQHQDGYLSKTAVMEVCLATGIPAGKLYHMASFYDAFTLSPDEKPSGNGATALEQAARLLKLQVFGLAGRARVDIAELEKFAAPGTLLLLRKSLNGESVAELERSAVDRALGLSDSAGADIKLDLDAKLLAVALEGGRSGNVEVGSPDSGECTVELARAAIADLAVQSCGTCTPCREGLPALAGRLSTICAGRGDDSDLEFVGALARTVAATSLCKFGQTAANLVKSTLQHNPEEYARVLQSGCPATDRGAPDKEVN